LIFYQLVKFLNGEISAATQPPNQRKKLKPIVKKTTCSDYGRSIAPPLFPPQTLHLATSATSVLLT
jgi:hypothetical protein